MSENQKLSERLKSLMWELGTDRYLVMRELILAAERLETYRASTCHFPGYCKCCGTEGAKEARPAGLAAQIEAARARVALWPPDVRAAMGLPDETSDVTYTKSDVEALLAIALAAKAKVSHDACKHPRAWRTQAVCGICLKEVGEI